MECASTFWDKPPSWRLSGDLSTKHKDRLWTLRVSPTMIVTKGDGPWWRCEPTNWTLASKKKKCGDWMETNYWWLLEYLHVNPSVSFLSWKDEFNSGGAWFRKWHPCGRWTWKYSFTVSTSMGSQNHPRLALWRGKRMIFGVPQFLETLIKIVFAWHFNRSPFANTNCLASFVFLAVSGNQLVLQMLFVIHPWMGWISTIDNDFKDGLKEPI